MDAEISSEITNPGCVENKEVTYTATVTLDDTVYNDTFIVTSEPVGHSMQKTEKAEPTCTETGKEAYYTCTACGKYFEDEAGNTEITDLDEYGIIPATGHTAGAEWKSDDTNHWNECAVCGEKMNETAHTFAWVTDKEATATEPGSRHEECTVYGYAKAAEEIPATGTPADTSADADTDKLAGTDTGKTSPNTGASKTAAPWIALLSAGAGIALITLSSKKRRIN